MPPLFSVQVKARVEPLRAAALEVAADLLLNFGQVAFLRRFRLIAVIAHRIGFYAVGHVVYALMG